MLTTSATTFCVFSKRHLSIHTAHVFIILKKHSFPRTCELKVQTNRISQISAGKSRQSSPASNRWEAFSAGLVLLQDSITRDRNGKELPARSP